MTAVVVKNTPQGLLIPRSELEDWHAREIEVIREEQQIIIRPKPASPSERETVVAILESAGLLLPTEPAQAPREPLSAQEAQELARKFSVGRPLSKIIIEERQGR